MTPPPVEAGREKGNEGSNYNWDTVLPGSTTSPSPYGNGRETKFDAPDPDSKPTKRNFIEGIRQRSTGERSMNPLIYQIALRRT